MHTRLAGSGEWHQPPAWDTPTDSSEISATGGAAMSGLCQGPPSPERAAPTAETVEGSAALESVEREHADNADSEDTSTRAVRPAPARRRSSKTSSRRPKTEKMEASLPSVCSARTCWLTGTRQRGHVQWCNERGCCQFRPWCASKLTTNPTVPAELGC